MTIDSYSASCSQPLDPERMNSESADGFSLTRSPVRRFLSSATFSLSQFAREQTLGSCVISLHLW